MRDMKVWAKIPRTLAQARGWKISKTRWIDINKGDDDNPVYKSRLVGKEFNNETMDGIFAGTPPLEALRYTVHEAATIRQSEDTDSKIIMINDVPEHYLRHPRCGRYAWKYQMRTLPPPTERLTMWGISK